MASPRTGALVLALAAGCTAAEAPPEQRTEPALEQALLPPATPALKQATMSDLRGIVREVAPQGWMLVETIGSAEPLRVRLDFRTTLQFDGGVAGHWGDLAVGRQVEVWLQNASLESPARLVLIEDDAVVDGER
jgi:hypothetical protein